MNRASTILSILALALLISLPTGCRSEGVEIHSYEGKPREQKYDLDEVKRRAKDLQPGMAKLDVLLRLGSPAIRENTRWVYLPSRTGTIIPADALEVRFDTGGRFVETKWQPVIGGERIITQ
jgi:outer membrane protein assembly factor BamE (lipoprotein component of BamABCDE complex)